MRGQTNGVVGSVVGSGTIKNFSVSNAGVLVTGYDNASGTFSGRLLSDFSTGLLGVRKVGTGNWTLTGNSSASLLGALTLAGGSVSLNAGGSLAFATYNLQRGGLLSLTNSAAAANNRLGGGTLYAGNTSTLTPQGGELFIGGHSTGTVTETVATLTPGEGGGIITLNAANTAGVSLALSTLSALTPASSLLVRGDNLGLAAASAGTAAISVTTFNAPGTQGGGANGTTFLSIRPDILADTSAAGFGSGFAVRDSSGVIRPLNQVTELQYNLPSLSNTIASGTLNFGVSSLQAVLGSGSLNSLTLLAGGTLAALAGTPDTTRLTVNTGGILSVSGNTSLNVPLLTSTTGTLIIQTTGASVLNLTGSAVNAGGLVKAGNGTLILRSAQYYTGGFNTVLNAGTLRLDAGTNTLLVAPSATVPTLLDLRLNGGTFDLNGNNQAVGQLLSVNTFVNQAGVLFSRHPRH
jgi:autotransporter-associated beta strand protein